MGVWGWEELADGVVLEGIVEHVDAQIAGDGDWNIHVRPAVGFGHLCINPHVGLRNTNGLVECEVEPPDRIAGENAEDNAVFHRYMDQLAGKFVRVVGTWAIDCSHTYDGDSCETGCCDEGKTEIHPVLSTLVELTPSEGAARCIGLFVFSDSSSNSPASVPHSHTSRIANFRVPVGPADPLRNTRASYIFRSEVNQAASKWFSIEEIDGEHVFIGAVTSGTEAAGTGFYHATVDLFYESHNPNPAPWLELLLT